MAGLFEELAATLSTATLPAAGFLTRENASGTGSGVRADRRAPGASSMAFASPQTGAIPPDDPAVRCRSTLRALTPLDILPGLAERMMTITLHIAWSLLVLAAVVYGRKALLALAVLWHAGVDAAAVYLVQLHGVLVTEGVIFLFAVLALAYILWEWRRMGVRAAA